MKQSRRSAASRVVAELTDQPIWSAARRLLDQQAWCFGRDIAELDGNVLVVLGFERVPPQRPVYDNSYYTAVSRRFAVTLWSWGVFFSDRREFGVLLKRSTLEPLLTESARPPRHVWASDLVPVVRPRNAVDLRRFLDVTSSAFEWFADYERWIVRRIGPEHRRQTIDRWWKTPRVEADDMPSQWSGLAAWCRNYADRLAVHREGG